MKARGDRDGRGNLSEQALIDRVDCVPDTGLDQVGFMAGTLDFASLKTRIEAGLVFRATELRQGVRQESLRGLRDLFLAAFRPTPCANSFIHSNK